MRKQMVMGTRKESCCLNRIQLVCFPRTVHVGSRFTYTSTVRVALTIDDARQTSDGDTIGSGRKGQSGRDQRSDNSHSVRAQGMT